MATNSDCLFCKIAGDVIPVTRVYESEAVIAFPDINPQAPVHLLIIPRQHYSSLARTPSSDQILGQLLAAANEIAQQLHLDNGFRVVINTGPDGGQTVEHLHLHLLGGRQMHWPPG